VPGDLRLPRRLLLPDDLQGRGVTEFTPEQQRAIDRRDESILVSAGAGTGKTSVLVERFVRAVLDDEVAVESILAITFTEKAAAQLKARVRGRFEELGARDEARAAEGAWISTIHGFCSRVLRTHALAAGIDPEYHVLDGLEAERLGIDAFDAALAEFLRDEGDAKRLLLVASHTPDKLADMVRTAYGHLRSRGVEPELPVVDPPPVGDEHPRLAAAARAALGEIGALEGKAVERERDRIERCLAVLERHDPAVPAEPGDIKDLGLKPGNARALAGPACAAYAEAQAAYASLCNRRREQSDHILLRELVRSYGSRYADLKRDRSGLDFDDLELLARDLLKGDAAIRAHYAERFAHVMVDEFQDTNPLQNELLSLLERGNLFRVGDELQSIYRFRHADVGVFRSHREEALAAGRAERIGVNFRSRGEILDAVDLAFGELWGERFEPLLEPPGAARDADAEPAVELIVSDRDAGSNRWRDHFGEQELPFGPGMEGVTPWRAAEARTLARRIDELTADDAPFEWSDVVVLVRATTHLSVYERALEERGVATYVLGGRGYWSQQQVADLRAWLAALANPLDALALYTALGSPLGGVGIDALVLVGAAARDRRQEVWEVIEAVAAGDGLELEQSDAERIRAFADRLRTDRAAAPRISLETLIDRAVTESGYDRRVLALPAGDRRMANVRKLMRLAREYEADEGRDLRGFIDFVAERDLIQEREGQAPLEAEDLDAVRLMTVHRAKGLEFPLVCVADLGKEGREDDSALRITDDGSVGIRLAQLGGGAIDSEQLARIRAEQKVEDEEEERRVFYVAATRAQRHLILSGATDLAKLGPAEPLREPMRWLWPALAPGLGELGASGIVEAEYDGRAVRVRCEKVAPATLDDALPAHDRDPAAPEEVPAGLEALAAETFDSVPVPLALPVSRLSYSGLGRYARCGYRFYLERALGLPDAETLALDGAARVPEDPATALAGVVRGSIVHAFLERIDFGRPEAPDAAAVAERIAAAGETVREHEAEEIAALVAGFLASDLRARIAAAADVRPELQFAFTLEPPGASGRSLLINGVVDVHATEADRVLVVDYKSDRLEERTPAELTEDHYSTQRVVYALAALRSGAERVEVAYCFLERPDDVVSTVYTSADEPELERRLLELAAGVVEGRFEPSPEPHRQLCADCPGRAGLCSWDSERTLAELP
jgi:ATP-dependent exoDNAse (exonuclease V) beta subunit